MDETPEHTTDTNGSAKESSQMLEKELMVWSKQMYDSVKFPQLVSNVVKMPYFVHANCKTVQTSSIP